LKMTDKKILLIEDNSQDQKIIQRYLGKAGHGNVVVAENGERGLELAFRERPDLVLLDTMLPGIDGFETCRQLKQNKDFLGKTVIMTGRIDAVDAQKARDMGADDYCVKTADCASLLTVVARILGESAAVAAAPAMPSITAWGQEKTNEAIKALYRELEKKNEELKALDKLKSEFVAMVSHELRTPLTIIATALSQIIDGLYGPVSEQQQQKINMALRNAGLLRRIIDDLLDMSKIEARALKLEFKTVDLVALAREVVGSFSALAQEHGLVLESRFSSDKIEASIDQDRIYQVFANLIGNALKFTQAGKITVTLSDQGDKVECRVSDTGRGIAPEDLPKVFGRFEQFGKSYRKGEEGTGLGLAISKGLIELHQGTIRVESGLNQGTVFIFYLPKKTG